MNPPAQVPYNLDYWMLQTVAMGLTAFFIPGLKVTAFFGPTLTVIALAFINSQIWDAALFLEIPNQFTLHALVLLVSNGVIFWILVKILPGIEIHGILPAVLAPVVFSITSLVVGYTSAQIDWAVVIDFCIKHLEQLKHFLVTTAPAHPPGK
jgi:uncharacterized membrane protein YvlD (DUF360 family)